MERAPAARGPTVRYGRSARLPIHADGRLEGETNQAKEVGAPFER
jgi:hypothetical protein